MNEGKNNNFVEILFMEKTEGIYTYCCDFCMSVFGIVAKLSVPGDRRNRVRCPNPECDGGAKIYGEGYMRHSAYDEETTTIKKEISEKYTNYPLMLNADQVSAVLGISKGWTYELMNRTSFPTIRIGRRKLVKKDDFLQWISSQQEYKFPNSEIKL